MGGSEPLPQFFILTSHFNTAVYHQGKDKQGKQQNMTGNCLYARKVSCPKSAEVSQPSAHVRSTQWCNALCEDNTCSVLVWYMKTRVPERSLRR